MNRRRYLSLARGAAVGATATGAGVSGRTSREPRRGEARKTLAAKRDRLDARRRELAAIRRATAALRSETERAREETLDDRIAASESLRARAQAVGKRVRRRAVLLERSDRYLPIDVAGWFVDEHHVVASDVLSGGPRTAWLPNGDSFRCEPVATSDWGPKQVGIRIYRTDYAGSPLPAGDSESLSEGDPLVQIAHLYTHRHWLILLGEAMRRATDDDVRSLRNTHSFFTYGSPVITLDGAVVGMANGYGPLRERPDYLRGSVIHEGLPRLAATRSVPIERIVETVEGET